MYVFFKIFVPTLQNTHFKKYLYVSRSNQCCGPKFVHMYGQEGDGDVDGNARVVNQ